MKFRKKIAALAVAAICVLPMAGCTSGTETSTGTDTNVEALLQKAEETMASVNSMSANMQMDLEIADSESTYKMNITSDMQTQFDPMMAKVDLVMTVDDAPMQTYTSYMVQEGETVDTYTNMMDEWYYQAMDLSAAGQYDATQNMELYLNNLTSFSVTGTEKINDVDTTVIAGELTGESMAEALKTSGVEDMSSGMGLSADDLVTLLDNVESLPVKLWISEDGYVMAYELDMTDMMATIMSNMAAGEETDMTINQTVIRMTCKDFNNIAPIEVPAEALATKA